MKILRVALVSCTLLGGAVLAAALLVPSITAQKPSLSAEIPAKGPETRPRATMRADGAPFDESICVKVGDEYFQAPAVWFKDYKPGTVNVAPKAVEGHDGRNTKISVIAWLPDFRPFEGYDPAGTRFAPHENGRQKPGPNERVFRLGYEGKYSKQQLEAQNDTLKKRLTMMSNLKTEPTIKEEYNLKFVFDMNNLKYDHFYFYNIEEENLAISGSCVGPISGKESSCQASFYFADDGSSYGASFGSADLARWRLIAEGSRKLFQSWRVIDCDKNI